MSSLCDYSILFLLFIWVIFIAVFYFIVIRLFYWYNYKKIEREAMQALANLAKNQKPMPPEFSKTVDEEFKNLI